MSLQEHLAKTPKKENSNIWSIDNVWKFAVIAFMAANLYLNQNFVNKAQFEKNMESVRNIELQLARVEGKFTIDADQSRELLDHELRLQHLEQDDAVNKSRRP